MNTAIAEDSTAEKSASAFFNTILVHQMACCLLISALGGEDSSPNAATRFNTCFGPENYQPQFRGMPSDPCTGCRTPPACDRTGTWRSMAWARVFGGSVFRIGRKYQKTIVGTAFHPRQAKAG